MTTKHFALLVCLHCTQDAGGDPLVMPFGGDTFQEAHEVRRAWWLGHKAGTGHTWAWANAAFFQAPPGVAARAALAYMAENEAFAPDRGVRA